MALDTAGTIVWAEQLGGANSESLNGISVKNGYIHLAGSFYNLCHLGILWIYILTKQMMEYFYRKVCPLYTYKNI